MKSFILATLTLVLLAPTALAHVETFTQAKTVTAGPYTVFLRPQPETVFANTTMTLSALVSKSDTGTPTREVTATVVIGGPNEYNRRSEMRDDRTGGLLVTSMVLPHRGNYSIRVLLKDPQNETHAADLEIEAYPNLPLRIRSGDAEQDVYTNESAKLSFEVVNSTTMLPTGQLVQDLRVQFEHWDDDHVTMYGVEEAEAKHLGDGRWEVEHTFRGRGMYHIKFASRSGGFTYSDVPVLHTYATANPTPPKENALPGASVSAVALAALAAALVVARRRRA